MIILKDGAGTHYKNRVLLLYPASYPGQMESLPLPLLYIAEPLLEHGFAVEILDQRRETDFFGNLGRAIGPDLVCIGITCMTGPQIEQVATIARFIRTKAKTPIVLGGPHPSLLPEETLASGLLNFIVLGRGESAFLGLVQALSRDEPIDRLPQMGGVKADGSLFVNRAAAVVVEAKAIPDYLIARYDWFSTIPIVTSFGCPYDCSFCSEKVLYPNYSERSAEDVVAMIEQALELKPGLIAFIDDNFLLNRRRVFLIFSLCERKGIRIPFVCTGRVDEVMSMSHADLRFLRARGLVGVFFGVESGSPGVLARLNKRITAEMVCTLNQRLKGEGIIPHYSFMAGFPGETKEDFEQTVRLMSRLKQENPQAAIYKLNRYTPYPGTRLFASAISAGFKPPSTFEAWSGQHYYSEEYAVPYDLYL